VEPSSLPKAFGVWFKDLNRWGVGSFRISQWDWPPEQIKSLASAVERRIEPIDKTRFELLPQHFVTVRFSGSIEQRDLHGKSQFKGGLFLARAGDLIYSKIDVRNGAIGIVPNDLPFVAVTSEFPVYRINHAVALPEYIQLVFRTRHFRQTINSMVSGTSGRKRVQPNELEDIKIPLPSISAQNLVVEHWRALRRELSTIVARIKKRSAQVDERFLTDLGFIVPSKSAAPRCFGVWWSDFHRWGVDYNQQRLIGQDITKGKFPVVELRSIFKSAQYGTSEKANSIGDGIPIIRMNNIVDGALSLSKLKHVRLPDIEISKLLLRNGDILFNRTNSKELVGKCAVFDHDGEYVFASYLIRVRVDTSKANPEFVVYALNSAIGRQQIDAISRQIIGQANINSQELGELLLPLPPLAVQDRMIKWVNTERAKIASDAQAAEHLEKQITNDVESMILGKVKVTKTK
jgi:type I restriction enzyme S subunit